VLLPEETDAVDHLLGTLASSRQALVETGILSLEELDALGGNDALDPGGFKRLQPCLSLQRTTTEGCELITEVLDKLLELRERGFFRTYAV
jgi:hypothetical protein